MKMIGNCLKFSFDSICNFNIFVVGYILVRDSPIFIKQIAYCGIFL